MLCHPQVVLLEDARDAGGDRVNRRDASLRPHLAEELFLEVLAQPLLAQPEGCDQGLLGAHRVPPVMSAIPSTWCSSVSGWGSS